MKNSQEEAPKKTGANAEMTLEFAQYVQKHQEAGTVDSLGLRQDEIWRAFRIIAQYASAKDKVVNNEHLFESVSGTNNKPCLNCDNIIERDKMSIERWVTRKYCCKACMVRHKRTILENRETTNESKPCVHCGNEFFRYVDDRKFHIRKYCNHTCKQAYYKKIGVWSKK